MCVCVCWGGGGGGDSGSVKVNKDDSECLLGFNYAFMPVLVTSNYLQDKQRIRLLVAFYRGNRLSFLFGLDRSIDHQIVPVDCFI